MVLKPSGPVSYKVMTESGNLRKCHIDQMRECVPEAAALQPPGMIAEDENAPVAESSLPQQLDKLAPIQQKVPVPGFSCKTSTNSRLFGRNINCLIQAKAKYHQAKMQRYQ